MQKTAGSPAIVLPRISSDLHLECGANKWMLLDFLNLIYVPALSNKVFFFRQIEPQ